MVYSVPDDVLENLVIAQLNLSTRYSPLLLESKGYMVRILIKSADSSKVEDIFDLLCKFMNLCSEDLTFSQEDLKELLNSGFNIHKRAKEVELNLEILESLSHAIAQDLAA